MTSPTLQIQHFVDRIDRYIVRFSQVLLALMVVVTFVSVVGRTFFSQSVPDDLLMSEILMVAIVFLPMGYVQSVGGHLEVTVITEHLPPKIQSVLVTLGLLLGIVFFGLMTWLSAGMALEAWELNTTFYASSLNLPEWPVKAMIPVGLAWWCLRLLMQLLLPATRPGVESKVKHALDEADRA